MSDAVEPDNAGGNADDWAKVPSNFRTSDGPLPQPWEARFGPLRRATIDDLAHPGRQYLEPPCQLARAGTQPRGHAEAQDRSGQPLGLRRKKRRVRNA